MHRNNARQLSFLFFMTFVIALLMTLFLVTQVKGQVRFMDGDWDWDDDYYWGGSRYKIQLRYNRVEGVYLGVHLKKEHRILRFPNRPFVFGFAGYSFSAKEFEYQIGIEKGFFDENRLALGAEYHDRVDTEDRWRIPDWENSLAAFFLKEDFQDFYLREGWSGYINQSIGRWLSLELSYHQDEIDSLKRTTHWALFGKGKRFRENPPIYAHNIRSLKAQLILDTRNDRKRTTRGWLIQVVGEHSSRKLGSEFTFDHLLVDLRRYQSIGFSEGIDIRLRLGTARGELPWHKSFHLGGLSTLRGFPYKALPNGPMNPGGNRMILAQVEYRLGTQDLPDVIDLGILELFNLIVFADFGWIGQARPDRALFKGFERFTFSSLKNDIGVALANRSGSFRIELIRRTDTGHKPYTLFFRLSRPF
jgi:outer membrane protein assembly factor BamA